jgi:3-isopropylmalate dehydrogenase
MKTYKIIVIPGDGIGPEIMDAAVEILIDVQRSSGRFTLDLEYHRGGAGCYRETGENISSETLAAIESADATLKGPSGLPDVRYPNGTEAGTLGGKLRVGFDLYANLRPITLLPGVSNPFSQRPAGSIDYLILRENSEGLYLSRGKGLVTQDAAMDTLFMTRKGCDRISRLAFDLALKKPKGAPEDGRRRVTLVHKSNILRSFHFFHTIFKEVAAGFPEVEAEQLYVDAAAAALIARPEHFQVIVTENMFGDILSDLGAATVGGLGVCPSANIGDQTAYFEPIHGSAPDIAGRNLANPLGQIRSAAMMLDYLGENKEAGLIEAAIYRGLEKGTLKLQAYGRSQYGAGAVTAALKEEIRILFEREK